MKIKLNYQITRSGGESSHNFMFTDDRIIREALRENLDNRYKNYPDLKIIEELGITHGAARIDIAVINGVMHGYEIKSDRDTLERLPEQVKEFNAVFDKLTLVVGKRHLHQAIHIVHDWWGIILARINTNGQVVFQTIREPEDNKGQDQDKVSLARLLWREEALQILEERNEADGVRSKPREFIYKKLAGVLETDDLKKRVNSLLISREGWRSGVPLASSGD